MRRATRCLRALANTVHQIAGDLAGFGPHAFDNHRVDAGRAVDDRLAAALAALLDIQSDLRRARSAYISEQIERLGLEGQAPHLKLNIGGGRHRLDGWVNIGAFPADLSLDLRWGLGLPDGSAQWIVMFHVLEHLYFPAEAQEMLKELRRVLAPDGVLRLAVPDIEKGLRAYADGDDRFFEGRQRIWAHRRSNTRLESFLAYAGAGPAPGHFLSAHKFGYDFETLEYMLRRAGFGTIERSGFMQSRHAPLRVDHASRVAGATTDGEHFSLFIEASS